MYLIAICSNYHRAKCLRFPDIVDNQCSNLLFTFKKRCTNLSI